MDLALLILSVAAALYVLITTAIIVHNSYFPIPLSDGWDEWNRYLAQGRNYSSYLFAQHNEHRIAVQRIFLIIDRYVFHARSSFILVCISLVQALTGFCLWRLFQLSGVFSRVTTVVFSCFILCCLFAGQQFNNLTWAFQLQFVAVYCTAVASILALERAAERLAAGEAAGRYVALTFLFAILSTYSMANGLLIWPVLVVLSLWFGMRPQYPAALGTATLLMATLYLRGYHSPGQTADPATSVIHHLPLLLAFAATYLGSPLDSLATLVLKQAGLPGDGPRVVCAAVFGAVGALTVPVLAAVLWIRRGRARLAQVALLHVLFFGLITACLVGMGRLNFPLVEAMTSRYVTPAMVFWISLVSLVWSLAAGTGKYPRSGQRTLGYAGLVLVMVFGIALHQGSWIQYSEVYAIGAGRAESAIVADVFDPQAWISAFHTPTAIFGAVDYLRANKLSVFTEDWTTWTGTPVTPRFTIDHRPGTCLGNFDEAVLVPSALKPGSMVSGWAWDLKTGRGPETIVLADDAGQVAGVARNILPRGDVITAVPAVQTIKVGWRGYIAGVGTRPITAYLLESDGRSLCSVGTLPTGYVVKESPFNELAEQVPGVTVALHGWTKNGYYPDSGLPPVAGEVYGSWSGSDANTGTLQFGPFRVANQLALEIPLYAGPRNGGLMVKVVNVKTGDLIAALSPPPLRSHWWAWHIDLPPTALDLEIIAEDQGRGWGEWQAIGAPHFLKGAALGSTGSLNESLQEVPLSSLGVPVDGGPPSIEGSWSKDGFYPAVGPAPGGGMTYGSWNGTDANTGTIRLGPFRIPGQRQVAIPLITGPVATGLEVTITDAASGQILGILRPPPVRTKWWAWKVFLPDVPGGSTILINAEDHGTGWGQWQAIGVPHLLK